MKPPLASVELYERDVEGRGARYEEVAFEDIHRPMLGFLPAPGRPVLDVGAGTGRDAAALAKRGYSVTAVEPSRQLSAWGQRHYAANGIEWINDSLPDLAVLRSQDRHYDFVLCSAVLMHVLPKQLERAIGALAALLSNGACLGISVRDRQASDPAGLFHDVADRTLRRAALAAGFELQHATTSLDQLGRPTVLWRSYVFCRPDDGALPLARPREPGSARR